MESLFCDNKRDEAINYLANLIFIGSQNAATVIKKINTACQNLEKFNDPNFLIIQWNKNLYINEIYDLADDWQASILIPSEKLCEIEYSFFKYSLVLSGLFYYKKTILDNFQTKKKHKWTDEDFDKLQLALLKLWEQNNGDINKKDAFLLLNAFIKAKNSFLFKSRKIDEALSINFLINKMQNICPLNLKPYQADMFKYYSQKFIENIPISFDIMNDHFEETGRFLHNFFK